MEKEKQTVMKIGKETINRLKKYKNFDDLSSYEKVINMLLDRYEDHIGEK